MDTENCEVVQSSVTINPHDGASCLDLTKARRCKRGSCSVKITARAQFDRFLGLYTAIVATMAGIVSFSSSVQTPAIKTIAADYHESPLLVTFAASSAYLLGFGSGPFVFSPLSEVLGRKKVYCGTFLVFTLMQLACALSPLVATLAVFRFVAGFSGGPTVANAGGSITDLWHPSQRSAPLAVYTVACYCGPVLGPLIAGALTQYTSWHWNFWLVFIISGITYIVMVCTLPETYHAAKQRGESSEKQLGSIVNSNRASDFARPWKMLATEPILLALSTFMAFIYGVLFLDFSAYPIVFHQERGWSIAKSGLSFLGVGTGMLVATACSPFLDRQYAKALSSSPTGKLEPEIRLRHLTVIAWLLPISLMWFAWTALPPIHWIVPILSGIPFGFSLVMLFLGINTYLTDCYARFSASALAANTMLRSLFGAAFALFAIQLYDDLGTPWATSLLGFIALALAPVPLLLWKSGAWLRSKSRFHQSAIAADVF